MLLVVFGAGASYDSVPHLRPTNVLPAVRTLGEGHHENDRPPLANQLFDTRPRFVEVMQRFPECLEVVPFLRKPDVVVERELAALREQARTFPRAHQELIAILLYLHFAIWECQSYWRRRHGGINNYVTFMRELERWRYEVGEDICFVTFNYDTMLEEAMGQVLGTTFNTFQKYLSQRNYSLIKLHGCITWGRELLGMQPKSSQELISSAAELEVMSDAFRIVDPPTLQLNGSLLYPALSIPVEKKDEFSCPQFHVQALKQILAKVTKIITVGWRGMEADFLQMLGDNLSTEQELLIVSGNQKGGNETLQNLKRTVREVSVRFSGETIVPEEGFTGLIYNLGYLNQFLRQPRATASSA